MGVVTVRKQTRDLLVIIVFAAIVIAGFYFALRSRTDCSARR